MGDTTYCNYPPAAKLKKHIGDSVVNYEEVVALKPDYIFADKLANEGSLKKLRELSESPITLSFTNMLDLDKSIIEIGSQTGKSKQAQAVVQTMHAEESAARNLLSSKQHSQIRYVFLVGAKPLWVAGARSFIKSLLSEINAVNVGPNTDYQSWSLESLIAANPNVIFCSADDKSIILSDPAWQSIPAVEHKNIIVINPDTTERPGPRLADSLLQIAKTLSDSKL